MDFRGNTSFRDPKNGASLIIYIKIGTLNYTILISKFNYLRNQSFSIQYE